MNGRRWRRQVARCFLTAGRPVSTGELCRWLWPRRARFDSWHYAEARALARELAERGEYQRRGRWSTQPGGVVWRLKGAPEPVERAPTGRIWPLGRKWPNGWPPDH